MTCGLMALPRRHATRHGYSFSLTTFRKNVYSTSASSLTPRFNDAPTLSRNGDGDGTVETAHEPIGAEVTMIVLTAKDGTQRHFEVTDDLDDDGYVIALELPRNPRLP